MRVSGSATSIMADGRAYHPHPAAPQIARLPEPARIRRGPPVPPCAAGRSGPIFPAQPSTKLLIVTARAEEALIETHVTNMLDLLRTLGDEIDLDRGISLYTEALSLDETLAGTVANRLLARLESPSQKDIRQAHRFRDVFKDGRRR
jgi:hypothetical protein